MVRNDHSVKSFNLNPWVLAFCASLTVILLQVIVAQHHALMTARANNDLHAQARDIEREMIRDLMYQLEQEKFGNELQQQRGYVAGVVDAVNRRDYFSEIWHSGYSRGVEVEQYANEIGVKTTRYTKDDGTPEEKKE